MTNFYRTSMNKNQKNLSSDVDESLRWILYPVDMRTPPGENTPNKPTVPPSPKPREDPHIPVTPSLPIDLPDISYAVLKSLLCQIGQDSNATSVKEDAKNEPVPPPPKPKPTSAMKPRSLVQDVAEKKPEKGLKIVENGLKIETEDETTKFVRLVHKFPHLYNTEDPWYRDKGRKDKSWNVISDILGMTAHDCRTRWKALSDKYSREMKELTGSGYASKKTMLSIDNMDFLPHENRTSTRRKNTSENQEPPMSPPEKLKKSKSSSHSVPEVSKSRRKNTSENQEPPMSPPKKLKKSKSSSQSVPEVSKSRRKNTSENQEPPMSPAKKPRKSKSSSRNVLEVSESYDSHSRSCSHSNTKTSSEKETNIQKENSKFQDSAIRPDQPFADDVALELQRFAPQQKTIIKAKIWQVFAEFGNPV